MSNEMLNEDIQNLFRDLLLQKDIESERRLLQENGVDVDDKSLEEFHKKKEELFDFAKKNKDKLQKLDVSDIETVSGGSLFFGLKDVLSAVVRGFWASFVHGSDGFVAAGDALMIAALTNTAFALVQRFLEEEQRKS